MGSVSFMALRRHCLVLHRDLSIIALCLGFGLSTPKLKTHHSDAISQRYPLAVKRRLFAMKRGDDVIRQLDRLSYAVTPASEPESIGAHPQ